MPPIAFIEKGMVRPYIYLRTRVPMQRTGENCFALVSAYLHTSIGVFRQGLGLNEPCAKGFIR